MFWKRFLSFAIILTALASLALTPASGAASVDGGAITSKGAIVLDFETGEQLYAYNADTMLAPASMTKVMTVYLVYEAISKGEIGFDTIVPISAYAYDFSKRPEETNVPLSRSEKYTVDELLGAVLVTSAGGATIALAELVGGSVSGFLKKMNAKAALWGIDAVFLSTQGGSGGSGGTRISPRAMAAIVRNFIVEFPQVLEKTAMPSLTFHGRTYENLDKLLGVYEGLDGFKTGTNDSAKECFAGTAKRGGVRIISVTMGSDYGSRFRDTTVLLDYGFAEMDRRGRKAVKTSSSVVVNGKAVAFCAYNVSDSNYFKLRDIAYTLSGSVKQFEVIWDGANNTILLTSGKPYTPVGGEMVKGDGGDKTAKTGTSKILLDGKEIRLTSYNIDGSNYFKLRDIGQALNFGVTWEGNTNTIIIDTGKGYTPG